MWWRIKIRIWYGTFFRSVIAFGRIHIIEDEQEKLETARMLGNRYNPNDDESLQKEIESGISRMLMIRFDIVHLTGKEAIELVKQRQSEWREDVFPSLCSLYTDIIEEPLIASHFLVYSGPTVLLLMDGKEVYRASQFIDLEELKYNINRYIELLAQWLSLSSS